MKTIWPHRSIDWIDAGGIEKPIDVPCGKCVACLLNKRTDWAFRLEQENKVSRSSHFVTLTYDRKHIRSDYSLNKRDLQLYLKRLRKKDETRRIRYYAVGEYGSKGGRPHYHILLFNSCEEHIRGAWCDLKGQSIGRVHVGKVTSASIPYVLKYVVQRPDAPTGVLRPFATMSRAYGIGGSYLTDRMVEWHRQGDCNYIVRPGNLKGRLPRFYREKIWHKPKDRERISAAALSLVQENQRLEDAYWKQHHGLQWQDRKAESRNHMLSRVKQKIKYSQTF